MLNTHKGIQHQEEPQETKRENEQTIAVCTKTGYADHLRLVRSIATHTVASSIVSFLFTQQYFVSFKALHHLLLFPKQIILLKTFFLYLKNGRNIRNDSFNGRYAKDKTM